MDEYIKEENIIKNETYEALKELLFCPICFDLILTPMECSKCQNCICKTCFDKWINKGKKCPNGCESEFHKVIEKKNHIFKIKFKCIRGCGAEIPFKDLEKHYNSDCTDSTIIKRMASISRIELSEEKNIKYFRSKNILNIY